MFPVSSPLGHSRDICIRGEGALEQRNLSCSYRRGSSSVKEDGAGVTCRESGQNREGVARPCSPRLAEARARDGDLFPSILQRDLGPAVQPEPFLLRAQ